MIVHVITDLAQAGAETALFRLLTAFDDPSEFHVISLTNDGVYGERLRAAGIPVTSLGMRAGRPSVRAFFRLVRVLRTLRPTLVQSWMYHADLMAGIAAKILGIPISWGIRHSNLDPSANKRSTLIVAKFGAWLSGSIPFRIVSCSRQAAATHRAFGYAPKFVVIPNGLDPAVFASGPQGRTRMRNQLGIGASERILGHVGRFDVQKDYPTFFAACAILRQSDTEFRAFMCGPGITDTNSELAALIDRFAVGDIVVLLGPRGDVPDLMKALDILVLSSLGEAFPNVVVEAMASAVPCVVTDVGDAAEIVGETGWVVPRQDPSSLAHALLQAINEPLETITARGSAARQRVKDHYAIDRMVAGYRDVWDQIDAV